MQADDRCGRSARIDPVEVSGSPSSISSMRRLVSVLARSRSASHMAAGDDPSISHMVKLRNPVNEPNICGNCKLLVSRLRNSRLTKLGMGVSSAMRKERV